MKTVYTVSYDYEGDCIESSYYYTIFSARASAKRLRKALKKSTLKKINYHITEYKLVPNGIVFKTHKENDS